MEEKDRALLIAEIIVDYESGALDEAAKRADDLIGRDRNGKNVSGLIESLCYKRMIFSAKVHKVDILEQKEAFLDIAKKAIEEANILCDNMPSINEGLKAEVKVHLASTDYDLVKVDPTKKYILNDSLNLIDDAILKLPGTRSYRAWPILLKVRVLIMLDLLEEAKNALFDGFAVLMDGYKESEKDEYMPLRYKVWQSGLHLGMAELCKALGYEEIAKNWAYSILGFDDPKEQLERRKNEARNIITTFIQPQ